MKTTKTAALAKAAALDIEVEDFHRRKDGYRHIHLYSPNGFVFAGLGTHNAGVHDGVDTPVDWKYVAESMELEPCPDAERCEVCNEEDEAT